MESNLIGVSSYHNMKSPIAMKKVPLKDVQNNNRSDSLDYTAKSWSLGLPTISESKIVGIKRPNPLSSPNLPFHQFLSETEVNDQFLTGGIKVDKEMAKRKMKGQHNTSRIPGIASVPDFLSSDNDHGQQRMGRLHRLHNLLKYYDELDRREYVHVLRSLAPLDLSRHAVELEKRSMQLSFEEGKEIQRMKALHILGNLQ